MRCNFFFQLFDDNLNSEITRLEFRNTITAFLEFILCLKFDNAKLQDKVETVTKEGANETMFNRVIDFLVEEVYSIYSFSGEIMTFEEWRKWFLMFPNIEEILDFSDILRNG